MGERALLKIPSSLAYGKWGNPHGFHSFGKGIPPDSDLEMDVELVSVLSQSQQKQHELNRKKPLQERLKLAVQLKENADSQYKGNHFAKACVDYSSALTLFDDSENNDQQSGDLIVSIRLNRCQCHLMQKQYPAAEFFA